MKDVACVLLGAGRSERMGGAKLLRELGGKTVFELSLHNHLASCLPVVCAVVAGWLPGFRRIIEDRACERVTFVSMDEPREMSDSLKAGWRWLTENHTPDAIMISLADKPLIGAQTIDLLIDEYSRSDRPICVPTFEGRRGHPVIVSTDLSGEIMRLEGDQGAREVLSSGVAGGSGGGAGVSSGAGSAAGRVLEVPVASDEVVLDFDLPEDMDILMSRLKAHE